MTMRTIGWLWMPLALGAHVGCWGCGGERGGPRPEAVSGVVTIDWKPLTAGTIRFRPASPGLATKTEASIVDGRYSITRERGLRPGIYNVVVFAPSVETSEFRHHHRASQADSHPLAGLTQATQDGEGALRIEIQEGGDNIFSHDFKTSPR